MEYLEKIIEELNKIIGRGLQYSQTEVSQLSGVPQPTINRMLNGRKVEFNSIAKVLYSLGYTFDQILDNKFNIDSKDGNQRVKIEIDINVSGKKVIFKMPTIKRI